MVAATIRPPASAKPGALVYINGGKLKALGDGRVGGDLVCYGTPKDSQGEWFDPQCEHHLEWYGGVVRPVLYHHGLEDEDFIEEIGSTFKIVRKQNSLWAEAKLNMADPRAQQVYRDVLAGKIGWSSGSAPHLTKVDGDGRITEWTLIEASLTPTPAAGKRTTVQALKFNYSSSSTLTTPVGSAHAAKESDGIKEPTTGATKGGYGKGETRLHVKPRTTTMAMKYDAAMIAALRDEGIESDKILNILEKLAGGDDVMMADETVENVDPATMAEIDDEEVKDAGPVSEDDNSGAPIEDSGATPAMTPPRQTEPPVGEDVKRGKSALAKAPTAKDIAKEFLLLTRTQPAASKAAGYQGRNPARIGDKVADIKSKFNDFEAEDMAYLYTIMKQRKGGGLDAKVMPPEYVHVMATKAVAQYEDKKLKLDPKVAGMARKLATKADFNNTTNATEGGNWVPDLWSSILWMRVRIDNNVARNIEVFQMPSPTFEYPIESTDPVVYAVGQTDDDAESTLDTNVFTRSMMAVDKLQFVAKKTGLQVGLSTELEEDSIIPFIPQLRAQATRAFANSIDFNLLNSDATTGTTNINYKGGNTSSVPTANFLFGGGDGIRHNGLVDNTNASYNFQGGIPTLTGIRSARAKMISSLNAYGINPEGLVIITDPFTYFKMLGIDEINIFLNNGLGATVNTGLVPNIDGTAVYASQELKLADSTGFVTNTNTNVPSSTQLGNFVIFAKNAWKVGYVRQVMTDVSYIPWNDMYVLTMTARYAIGKKDTSAAVVAYNINVQ